MPGVDTSDVSCNINTVTRVSNNAPGIGAEAYVIRSNASDVHSNRGARHQLRDSTSTAIFANAMEGIKSMRADGTDNGRGTEGTLDINDTTLEGMNGDDADALTDALFGTDKNRNDGGDINSSSKSSSSSSSSSSSGSSSASVTRKSMSQGTSDVIAVLEKLQTSLLDPSWFKRHGASLG